MEKWEKLDHSKDFGFLLQLRLLSLSLPWQETAVDIIPCVMQVLQSHPGQNSGHDSKMNASQQSIYGGEYLIMIRDHFSLCLKDDNDQRYKTQSIEVFGSRLACRKAKSFLGQAFKLRLSFAFAFLDGRSVLFSTILQLHTKDDARHTSISHKQVLQLPSEPPYFLGCASAFQGLSGVTFPT